MISEPCDEDHLLNLAAYWSALGMTSHACDIMSLYVDRFFPNNLDTDDRVIEAYLEGGRPELADAFIKRRFDELDLRPPPHNLPDKIPSDAPIRRYQDLDSKIRVCLERKARALRLADLAKEVIEDEPRQATRLLASAHELLPGDDDIRVNLAVALRSSDDAKSAFDHFLHASRTLDPPRSSACMANAAFCLFEQRQVAAGIELLHFAISEISDGEGRLKIADLPGVLGWVSGHTSMGNLGSAVRCLEHAVTICPHEHRRQLTALITLYRKAWEATSTRL
jgi:tetratricopeptide (TPR) repeat protein